jgi:Tfp pilus assembly protein PilO
MYNDVARRSPAQQNEHRKTNNETIMKETLEAEKARLTEVIKKYDDQHHEAAKLANTFRKQLKGIERAIEAYEEPTQAEVAQAISKGMEQPEIGNPEK